MTENEDNSKLRDLVRLDWAAKSILRQKENFAILEGLLSLLLQEEVRILDFLESESNAENEFDKTNRVDIKARDAKGEIILVEIQFARQHYFLQRMLYATSKTIVEHMHKGFPYERVPKVYSVNILYFLLGTGPDYLYHGRTDFIGMNTNDHLKIKPMEKKAIRNMEAYEVFPEYYLLRVEAFEGEPHNHLEEWMRYLKEGVIDPDTTAPGLKEAYERLVYDAMSASKRKAYDDFIDELRYQHGVAMAAREEMIEMEKEKSRKKGLKEGREEGREEGFKEGLEKGREEGERKKALTIAKRLKAMGMSDDDIASATD